MSTVLSLVSAATNSGAANVYHAGGRDKACRFGQYFSRLLVYLISQRMSARGKTPASIEWMATFAKTQAAMATTRKMMRSGKFIDFLQLFMRSLKNKGEDELVHLLGLFHKASMFVFMAADTLGLMGSTLTLVRLRDPANVTRVGQRGWLLAIVCQLISAAYQLHNISVREADLRRVRMHVEKAADVMGDRECALVASALDLVIPAKGLGLLNINEGLVALAGTVTSLMGIQDVVSKVSY
ncbi:peroxisomal biogenesis factor 11 [Kickxella alabastrina]|uniref:peroxisomal biogenesis factor 11 n=1 Tax=Kickxella alabastrina TaxID=61397 RepID=UPI002220EA23|nr:peroxisomal biogenesis factor 11 [Kickxella alabastrina]KAI7831937.1 peroxisomal biogenesis factor 11 [Kickxella alabastrina]